MPARKKITSSHVKAIVVITYIIVITLFDVYSYGIIYQEKIQKENYTHPVWQWVFAEEKHDEVVTVPRYRIIQKSLELGGMLIVFYFCGLWPVIGLALSHYLLSYDMLFYLVLNPGFVNEMERSGITAYWLVNWYQIGYFILQPFNSLYFYISGCAGILIAVMCCYVPVKRHPPIPLQWGKN